jgi:uncharacterized YccA/Bax inhibitor family protein
MWQSSNPVLAHGDDAFAEYYGAQAGRTDVTTMSGVVNKTGLLVLFAVAAGAGGYALMQQFPPAVWIGAIAGFIVCLGVGFVLSRKAHLAPILAPIYAIVEGAFLGAFTALADTMLASRGLTVAGGVGVQAGIITAAAMVSMLVLWKMGVRPTQRFKAILGTATGAIMIAYLVSFVLSIFWKPLPLISFYAAVQDQGMIGFLGLGINIFILVIASLWLIIDFELVEQKVQSGAPKYMEWFCGFALIVTLAWIYYEAVKLVVRLAILFGNRD